MGLTLQDLTGPGSAATFGALLVGSVLKHLWLRQARGHREELYVRVGQVASLHLYPIKGCGGVQPDPQSAVATRAGLFYNGLSDRRWMVLSNNDKAINMKTQPRLTLVTCTSDADWMIVSAPGMPPLHLPRIPDPAKFQRRTICVHDAEIEVLDCGEEAREWISRFLGQPANLAHSRPGISSRDAYDLPRAWENSARKGDVAVFAYLTSYLLTTTSSLADLNNRMTTPVSSLNFRPSIVIDNSVAFEEDNWEEIRIGKSAQFHYVEPCRRCKITTVDPKTADTDPAMQPLKTLQSYRQKPPYGKAPLFGAYVAIDKEGPISVGDPVYAIPRRA
ncbi:hypothetical protein BaRGS_00011546 [Batillaria attramentaria]|uniref:MOSC domain-containing protein n=1 Tax=Batillaria attramentaria TaxID=370345 RepID=A0ABD0LCF2_9CAEN